MQTVILLLISNVFMTLAWYGHLKFQHAPLLLVIAASWGIALFEYVFQVPANRIGSRRFSVTQLKIMQECITLFVFTIIAYLLFGQKLKWNNIIAYALVIAAVYFTFRGHGTPNETAHETHAKPDDEKRSSATNEGGSL